MGELGLERCEDSLHINLADIVLVLDHIALPDRRGVSNRCMLPNELLAFTLSLYVLMDDGQHRVLPLTVEGEHSKSQ